MIEGCGQCLYDHRRSPGTTGADITIAFEIQATSNAGLATTSAVVSENARTPKFDIHEFESE
jgi:hypothetical protein